MQSSFVVVSVTSLPSKWRRPQASREHDAACPVPFEAAERRGKHSMHRQMLIEVATLCVALGSPDALGQVHGDDGPAANTGSAAGGDAHGDGHGPIYRLLTIDGMTALWTIIIFVVLLVVLRAAAFKPIQDMLIRRERYIEDSLLRAKTERQDAEDLLRQYTEQIEKARDDASAIVEEGRRDAEVVRQRIEQEAQAEADATVERAKREIQIASETAVKELYDLTATLVTDVAGRIIRKELSPADHQDLVRESIKALAEMPPGSNGR